MNPGETAANGREAWLASVRARFLDVARRRVPTDVAEDLVQDALRILIEKGVDRPGALGPGGAPALAFGFAVLRNVIGNHYQKERVRRRTTTSESEAFVAPDPAPQPLESLASDEALRIVEQCLSAMSRTDGACARYLRRLVSGLSPRELAREEGLAEPVLYRRVYRCRLKLRDQLEQRGVFA